MIIAKVGKFTLSTAEYVIEHEHTTHDINICAPTHDGDIYVVAYFNKEGELISCEDRLLGELETSEDVENLKLLASIGEMIISNTEDVPSGYKPLPIKPVSE